MLQMIFEKFSSLNPVAGKPKFGIDESLALFGMTKMLGVTVSMFDKR